MYTLYRHQAILSHISLIHITPHFTALLLYKASRQISCYSFLCEENTNQSSVLDWSYNKKVSPLAQLIEGLSPSHASHQLQQLSSLKGSKPERASIQAYSRLLTEIDCKTPRHGAVWVKYLAPNATPAQAPNATRPPGPTL